eukprot:Skav216775  [mRNA]  locus=scaffold579:9387:10349:+ [translate_table: standard]
MLRKAPWDLWFRFFLIICDDAIPVELREATRKAEISWINDCILWLEFFLKYFQPVLNLLRCTRSNCLRSMNKVLAAVVGAGAFQVVWSWQMAVPPQLRKNCSHSADPSPMIPSLELNCKPTNFDCKVDRGLTCSVSSSNVVCIIPDEDKCINLKSLANRNANLSWYQLQVPEKHEKLTMAVPAKLLKNCSHSADPSPLIPSLELTCKPAHFHCNKDRGLTCEANTSNVECSIPDDDKCVNLKSLSSHATLSWRPEKHAKSTTKKTTTEKPVKPTMTVESTTPTTTEPKQIPSLESETDETSGSQMVGIAAALGLVQLQLF